MAAVRRRLHRARRRGAGVRQPHRVAGHDPRPVPPAGRARARRAVRAAAPRRRDGRSDRLLRPRDRRRRQPARQREPRRLAGRRRGPLLRLHAGPAGGQPAWPGPHRRERPLRGPHGDPRPVHDPARRADGEDDRRRRLEPVAPGPHPPHRERRGLRAAGHAALHRLERLPRQRRRERGEAGAHRPPEAERGRAGGDGVRVRLRARAGAHARGGIGRMAGALRVAVVGGGIGGLTLAIALRRRGVAVTVYEQAPDLREIGAGVALSANATRHLHRLGLGDALEAVSVQPSALVFRRWSGEVVAAHEMDARYRAAFGAPYYGVHRAALQRVFDAALEPGVVERGCRCVGVAEDGGAARIELADGRGVEADVVVGADGVHSAVRRHVAGDRAAVFSGTVGYRGLVPVERLPSLPDPTPLQFWAGPRAHLLHYSIEGGRVVNYLAVVRQAEWTSEAWNEPCAVADALAAFEGWDDAVTEMVGGVPEGSRWALHDHAPLERWSAGRVALIGDAAHAM